RRGLTARDPFRKRDYEIDGAATSLDRPGLFLIRPGYWLSTIIGKDGWFLFDPDTRTSRPVPWEAGENIVGLFADGRLLLDREMNGLALVDPEAGSISPLRCDDVPPPYHPQAPWRRGPFVLEGNVVESPWGLLVIDEEGARMHLLASDVDQ